jgi:shikimate dehydrogenase
LPDVKRERVVQLGAGGAGTAMAHAALTLGVAQLMIVDTNRARAEHAAAGLEQRFGPGRARATRDLSAAVAEADRLINATPVGMGKYPGLPLPLELLRHDLWVADIVYFPLETELLKQARMLGCRTLAGGGMAVFQAAEAFHLFTGVIPDSERMLRHFTAMTNAERIKVKAT